jgi:hypothetical protein
MGIKKYVVFLLLIVLSISCSIQKRLYNKGFYLGKNQSLKKVEQKTEADSETIILTTIKQIKAKTVSDNYSASILNKKSNLKIISTFSRKPESFINSCDTLFLRNGAKILANVKEVNSSQIKFTYCETSTETIRILNKTDIDYIVYVNGLKETFADDKSLNSQTKNNNYKEHRARIPAIMGLIFLVLGIFLFLLLFIPSIGIGFALGLVDLLFALVFFIAGLAFLFVALAIYISN